MRSRFLMSTNAGKSKRLSRNMHDELHELGLNTRSFPPDSLGIQGHLLEIEAQKYSPVTATRVISPRQV